MLNYFGSQRFGGGRFPNSVIGAALLRAEYEMALVMILDKLIGATTFERSPETLNNLDVLARLNYAEDRSSGIYLTSSERQILAAIKKYGISDPVRILDSLPRDIRRLYVESIQSELWNALCSCWATMKSTRRVRSGDLVVKSSDGRPLTAWDMPHEPKDSTTVHVVSESEEDSGLYRIEHLVLPLVGTDVNITEMVSAKLMSEAFLPPDLVDLCMHDHKLRELRLKGGYRHVVVQPKELSVHVKGDGNTVLSFDLAPGSYATEAVRALTAVRSSSVGDRIMDALPPFSAFSLSDARRSQKHLTLLLLQDTIPLGRGRLLLGMKRRGHGAGKWNAFGGKIEPGESILEGALREMKEECGLSLTQARVAGNIIFDTRGRDELLNIHVLLSSWPECVPNALSEPPPVETDEMSPAWFNCDSIPYDQMWSDMSTWLPSALSGSCFRARFRCDEDESIISFRVDEVESKYFDGAEALRPVPFPR